MDKPVMRRLSFCLFFLPRPYAEPLPATNKNKKINLSCFLK